jgi:nucleotide-binding universal stress UspA family protein
VQSDCQAERRATGWRQVAVVVDNSEASLVALQSAVAASRRYHARLTMISVAPRPWATVGLTGMCPRRLEAEATAQAAATVRRLAATLPADVPCTTVVRCGRVVKVIPQILREHCCNLVFVALGPGRALGGRRGRWNAVRLMRSPDVDFVLLNLSPPTPARTSSGLLAAEGDGELCLPNWELADISVN